MSWTAASQLKPSAQDNTADHPSEEEFEHNKVLKIEAQCESLSRINVWVPSTGESWYAEERQLRESELLWQDPRDKWLKLIHQHCSGVKHPFVLLKGDIERPWRLLCSKEDVRAYFKIISTVHKLQPLSHAPDVKRDVVVKGSNIEKDDISAAVLQQLTDVMVKSGWEMCPQPSQQAAGACLLAKMATTDEHGEGKNGVVVHNLACLNASFTENAVHVAIQLQRQEAKLFDVLKLLDGSLKKEWQKAVASSTDVNDSVPVCDKSLRRRIKHALHGCPCVLFPCLGRCALDNAFSDAVPCQLLPSTAAPDAKQHCCTVNFNADGSLWACVPASCLLTGCTTAGCSPDTETRICDDLAQQLKAVIGWTSGKADSISVAEPKAGESLGRSQAHGTGASQGPRERRHQPLQISANLMHYLSTAQPETGDATKSRQKPKQALTNKKAVTKPPNAKNAPKATKRPGQSQPTSGTAKAAKTAKGASTSKANASKAAKAAQAKTAATTAAALFSAVQKNTAAGTSGGTNAADANTAGTDAAEPAADQAPKRDRKKASDINVEEAVAKVKAAKAGGTLAKLSLLELKAYLKSVGKPVGGKKADLMERIEAVVEP